MKKRRIKKVLSMFLAFCLCFSMIPGVASAAEETGTIDINETNFPDADFREYVNGLPGGGDGRLTPEEMAAITTIDCKGKGISKLNGIEYFTALTTLDCSGNSLTGVNLSQNKQLSTLNVSGNQLTDLDISAQALLNQLYVQNNKLQSLDLSANTNLSCLDCSGNQLTSLDLTSLTTESLDLTCTGNERTVADGTALSDLGIDSSKATVTSGGNFDSGSISFKNNSGTIIYDYETGKGPVSFTLKRESFVPGQTDIPINETNFPDDNFRKYVETLPGHDDNKFTPEGITSITHIDCHSMGIENLKGIEYFTELTILDCHENPLTSLDVSQNTKLEKLWCQGNNTDPHHPNLT